MLDFARPSQPLLVRLGLLLGVVATVSWSCADADVLSTPGGAGGSGGGNGCHTESCNGFDDDCDGLVDEDCPCTNGVEQECYPYSPTTFRVGRCIAGAQRCDSGAWGPCLGMVGPTDELCNGLDDDCNGAVDEGCSCPSGGVQFCYSGTAGTEGVGSCQGGSQLCSEGAWGLCMGEVVPTEEQCDNQLDDDCDGEADEQCTAPPPERCLDQFEDVPPGHPAYAAAHALYVHEVVDGCSAVPLLFCPANPAWRKHFAVMLINAMGESPSGAAMNAYFSDLTDALSAPYINRLFELALTTGCQPSLFCPDNPTTREHAAVFLVRSLGELPSNATPNAYFDDVAGAQGVGYINRIYELGITMGCGTRLYCPADPLLRAQAAVFLANAFDYTLDICTP